MRGSGRGRAHDDGPGALGRRRSRRDRLYPRFFEWYDIGTEALFASLGLTWAEAFPRYGIVGVPILEAGSRFVAPVRYGDAAAVRTRVVWAREKTFRAEHELSVGDRRCADGFEIRA